MPRVLVVEDQEKLRRNLEQVLVAAGYDTRVAGTGDAGYQLAVTEPFDALILDLTLPGRDGMQVLADLRARGFRQPILILTARDAIEDRVAGLDSGADDYLVKPFAHAELVARLRALLRRGQPHSELVLRCGDLEMDLVARRVVRGGRVVELSQREYALLEYLLRHKNAVVARETLARDVWKEPAGIMTNVIEVCINSLRKKIESAESAPLIRTIRGVGYTVGDAP